MRNHIICLMSGLMLGGMAATASGVELTPEQQRDVDECGDADVPMASLIESVDDLGLDDPDDEAKRVFLEDAASFLRWPKFEVQRH